MRRFFCGLCDGLVAFDSFRCPSCGVELGYVPEGQSVCTVHPVEPTLYSVRVTAVMQRRCLNAAWGCNWMVSAVDGSDWCRACQLTRGRPDETDPMAVDAWASAEAIKRRLIHQLDELGLPIHPDPGDGQPDLVFDFVYLPGEVRVTGHLDGVVTLDLTEADDVRREELRRSFQEPLRTILGHLRHEVGHYYWRLLAARGEPLERFRPLFGDERVDYVAALEAHHVTVHSSDPGPDFVTPYAASHPLEDWAETFAHYLHIHDALGSADSTGLRVDLAQIFRPRRSPGFRKDVARWLSIATAVNEISRALGTTPVYPVDPGPGAIDKLEFVHDRISEAARTTE
jgi:hypothetical protein